MPALLTHYLCGSSMLELMENNNTKQNILKHRNVFNLGTQGPDILFYYGAWPWAKSNGIPKLGNRIHESSTGEFFAKAFEYIAAAGSYEQELLSAYMCGYLCHFSLDCHTHPYIFYRTGFVLEGEEYTEKYNCYHRMFETALDVLMLKHLHSKRPAEVNPSVYMRISRKDAEIIGKLYETVIEKLHGVTLSSGIVSRAISDIAGITSALRDRYGLKKKLLSWLEEKQGKLPLMSSMILPQEIKDGLDYLNLSHSVWYLPWNTSIPQTSSFIELFNAAVLEAKEICDVMNTGQVLKLIGNRSFSTGIDCDSNIEFKHFDCIYE